jgi:hypothetical protein
MKKADSRGNLPDRKCYWPRTSVLVAIVTDCFHGAPFKGLHALLDIFIGRRLFVDEGIPTVLVARKEIGRGLPAQVAIDTLFIDIKLAANVFWPFVVFICHIAEMSFDYSPECQGDRGPNGWKTLISGQDNYLI